MASEQGQIIKNTCVHIVLPKQIKREKSDIFFYTDEEVQKIIEAAIFQYNTGRYKYLHGYAISIFANTGMRVG